MKRNCSFRLRNPSSSTCRKRNKRSKAESSRNECQIFIHPSLQLFIGKKYKNDYQNLILFFLNKSTQLIVEPQLEIIWEQRSYYHGDSSLRRRDSNSVVEIWPMPLRSNNLKAQIISLWDFFGCKMQSMNARQSSQPRSPPVWIFGKQQQKSWKKRSEPSPNSPKNFLILYIDLKEYMVRNTIAPARKSPEDRLDLHPIFLILDNTHLSPYLSNYYNTIILLLTIISALCSGFIGIFLLVSKEFMENLRICIFFYFRKIGLMMVVDESVHVIHYRTFYSWKKRKWS